MNETEVVVVCHRAGGSGGIRLARDLCVDGLGDAARLSGGGSVTLAQEHEKLAGDIKNRTKVESSNALETGLDVVVKRQDSVTDTASDTETERNLVDHIATGGDTAIFGAGGGRTRNNNERACSLFDGRGRSGGDLGEHGSADGDFGGLR